MNKHKNAWQVLLAASALWTAGVARADWLAADPGTPISLQINVNGDLVVRPFGGAWSHPLCSDVSAAMFATQGGNLYRKEVLAQMLIAAAVNASMVNVFADADECDAHGHPLIRNIRIQGA